MSRTRTRSLGARLLGRARRTDDDGFTLLEVIVSLGLFAVFSAAITPLLISSTRATLVTKLDTGARNLTQERFEVMRNLPFHLDVQVDTTPDLLDVYFPNLGGAPNANSAGYVSTGARRPGEPTTGPYYRTVFSPVPGFSKYQQYVATQFLNSRREPVTPASTYNRQVVAADQPPSLAVSVTVITVWNAGTLSKSLTVESEIADGRPQAPRVALEARSAALRVLSVVEGQDLLFESGVVNLDGSLTTGSSAGASARGAFASLGDVAVHGARRAAIAPPTAPSGNASGSLEQLLWGTREVARFARSDVDDVGASTPAGEPVAGSASDPVTATMYGNVDTRISNLPDVVDPGLLVRADLPVVSMVENGSAVHASGTGWMRSSGGASHAVQTGSTARTSVVRILPTVFAPDGLIQVTLDSASLGCVTNGGTGSITPEYRATLRYWQADPLLPGAGGYVTAAELNHLNSTDPLAGALNLTVGTGGTVVHNDGLRPLYLGEYFKTVASHTSTTLEAGKSAENGVKRLKASYAGMVSIATVPLRQSDELSNVAVQLGALSCLVEDNR